MAQHRTCDYCGTDQTTLPKRMIALLDREASAPFDFCGRRCLAMWSLGDAVIPRLAKPEREVLAGLISKIPAEVDAASEAARAGQTYPPDAAS